MAKVRRSLCCVLAIRVVRNIRSFPQAKFGASALQNMRHQVSHVLGNCVIDFRFVVSLIPMQYYSLGTGSMRFEWGLNDLATMITQSNEFRKRNVLAQCDIFRIIELCASITVLIRR